MPAPVVGDLGLDPQDIDDVVDYLCQVGIEVITARELLERIGELE